MEESETYCPSWAYVEAPKAVSVANGVNKELGIIFFVINWKHCSLILSTFTIGFGIKTQHCNYYPLCFVKGISFP